MRQVVDASDPRLQPLINYCNSTAYTAQVPNGLDRSCYCITNYLSYSPTGALIPDDFNSCVGNLYLAPSNYTGRGDKYVDLVRYVSANPIPLQIATLGRARTLNI